MHISGAGKPDQKMRDGVNLIPYLDGTNSSLPHKTLFWRTGNKAALRHGDWKLLRNPGRGQSPDWQLYQLAQDIAESNNLANAMPAKKDELIGIWESLNREMMDPVWQP